MDASFIVLVNPDVVKLPSGLSIYCFASLGHSGVEVIDCLPDLLPAYEQVARIKKYLA